MDVHEVSFGAMGSDTHLVVVGGPPSLVERGRERIAELERRWSRFLPDSEISRLNAAAGTAVMVSDDTVALVSRAIEGWRFTGGSYDPTVLGAMLRAGYDRTFDDVAAGAVSVANDLFLACTDIVIEGDAVTMPAGSGFDPGGVGKGLAADLVAVELREAGADGVCVNMGGDVRVSGESPDGNGWGVAVQHLHQTSPLVVVHVTDGAVATSTTLKRRWTIDGQHRHHLIDPRTGEPADTDLDHVTVVAGSAWAAEVLAKAVLIRGSAHPFDLVDGVAAALVVTVDGTVLASEGFAQFCATVPARVESDPTP
jgi:thiamine biosynthesis lipoprotein